MPHYVFEQIRADINAMPVNADGLPDEEGVDHVLKFWEQNWVASESLSYEMSRLKYIIYEKPKLVRSDVKEARDIIMRMHMPLITHKNHVIGLRLRDVYYFRLINKIAGCDIEDGVEDYKTEVELYHDELERKTEKMKDTKIKKARKRKEAAKKKAEQERQKQAELNVQAMKNQQ